MTCQKVKKKNKITTLDILLGCTLQRIKKSHADLGTTDLLQKVVRPLKKTTLPRYSTRKATSFEVDTAGKYDRQRKPNYERLISQNSTLLYQQNNQNLGDQGIFKIFASELRNWIIHPDILQNLPKMLSYVNKTIKI